MKKNALVLLGIALLSALFLLLYKNSNAHMAEADRYYHIALSRIMSESPGLFPRELPQVGGLGWNRYFPDKEFLFHQVTSLGFTLAGEGGVVWSGLLCVLLCLAFFFWYGTTRIHPVLALAATLLAFFDPFLYFRLTLLRPHVLAVLAFVLLLQATLSRRIYLTAAAAMLFTLSYHAFYVPISCLLILGALAYVFLKPQERAPWLKLVGAGVAGCVAGVLLNPYFPSNVELAIIHARIPNLMRTGLKGLDFGEELFPLRSDLFLYFFYLPLGAFAVAMFAAGKERLDSKESRERFLCFAFLLAINAYFIVLTCMTRRAAEYLIPGTGFLLLALLERVPAWTKPRIAAFALFFVVQAAIFLSLYMDTYRRALNNERDRATFAAIDSIPREPAGAKVFNCEWDRTPYLFYKRPDLRFVDILDPSLLFFANYPAFQARIDLRRGSVADAFGMLRRAFHADYVMCIDPSLVSQLSGDPDFSRIFPGPKDFFSPEAHAPAVFRVAKEPAEQYVRSYELRYARELSRKEFDQLGPAHFEKKLRVVHSEQSAYISLLPLLKQSQTAPLEVSPARAYCASLRPTRTELERFAGARYALLGGGQELRVWRNGQPIFRTVAGFDRAQVGQVALPLEPPLHKDDALDFLVCSPSMAEYWGFSVSLWKERECFNESEPSAKTRSPESTWKFEGIVRRNCLGPLAAPLPLPRK